jgi:hypothetical protein
MLRATPRATSIRCDPLSRETLADTFEWFRQANVL